MCQRMVCFMERFNILVDDENIYFSMGLKRLIKNHADDCRKRVFFLMTRDIEVADVVFISFRRFMLCGGHINPSCRQVVVIKDKRLAIDFKTDGVLYRSACQEDLYRLMTRIFIGELNSPYSVPMPLTPREQAVINCLCRGMSQSQAARIMGVSPKTVHSHKRSIMKKLLLKKQREFAYLLVFNCNQSI